MKIVEARKLDMSQIFREDGRVIPVTLVSFENFPGDLAPGTMVKVVGISKGKGFAGVMKRHGFAGMPATHGRSTKGRAPGSIGGTTTPGRVYKGKKMAGRMGGERITVWGLSVIEVDPDKKIAKISGPLPGSRLGKIAILYEPQEVSAPVLSEGDKSAEEAPTAVETAEKPEGENKEVKEEKESKEKQA